MKNKKLILILSLVVIITVWGFNIQDDKYTEMKTTTVFQKKLRKTVIMNAVPVLMYHSISNTESELCVSPSDFESQIKWLSENNYTTITLKDLYLHWSGRKKVPEKPIILSFDDGYLDNYTQAYRVMKEYNFVGVLFIYRNKFNRSNSVSIKQVLEMQNLGWEIGNHSYNHIELPSASSPQLIKETKTAKEELSDLVNSEIVSFCYPAGKYNKQVVQAVLDSGHKIAVTTNYGYSKKEQGILTLSRIRINRSDKLNGFIRKLILK